MKAPQTKRSRGGAWALVWIGLLTFGAKAPWFLPKAHSMNDLEYARIWYSMGLSTINQIAAMREEASKIKKTNPDYFPEGTSDFDVYTHQIAAGAPSTPEDIAAGLPNPQDIPSAIQAVAYFIDEGKADRQNHLTGKVNTQSKRLRNSDFSSIEQTVWSLTQEIANEKDSIWSETDKKLLTLVRGSSDLLRNQQEKAQDEEQDGLLKRLEDIQGTVQTVDSSGKKILSVAGGLIGSSNVTMNQKASLRHKTQEITGRINTKIQQSDQIKTSYEKLAPAMNALGLLGDCSVFATQIDARAPLKTIPNAVESVVGDLNNSYGLIGRLPTPFDPEAPTPPTITDIYRRLEEALKQLNTALLNHFGGSYQPPTKVTLQGIIAGLDLLAHPSS